MSMSGEVIGDRYRISRLLGRGGTADVYEARDERTAEAVAVKVVRSSDPEFARRLVEEARALESLDGPGLVRLLDTGMVGDLAYLVMEYVDGTTLAQSLKTGPLGAPATASMAAKVAHALSYVHERGVVHRDVKPSNILRSTTGEVWLADFGIAKFDGATTITAPGTTIGTVMYMAPEQLDGQRVGPSGDVWSLGIVILECLTGRRVFEGSPSEIVAKRLTGPVELPADLPAPWSVLLRGMLDSRPERRLSGAEVASLLETSAYATAWEPRDEAATMVIERDSLAAKTSVAFDPPPRRSSDDTVLAPPPRSSGHDERRPWAIAGVLVIIGALLYALISLLTSSSPPAGPSTSTTIQPSTSTTVRSSSSIGASLTADLVASQAANAIDPAVAQRIEQLAQQSLSDGANANLPAVANVLQQAMTLIVSGVTEGTVSATIAPVLEHDVTELAAALGVGAPSTTTTTTTFAGSAPGNGHGKGIGKGRP